jgi:hypothetical protein
MFWVHLTKADILVGLAVFAVVATSVVSFGWWILT